MTTSGLQTERQAPRAPNAVSRSRGTGTRRCWIYVPVAADSIYGDYHNDRKISATCDTIGARIIH
jgi:hypothetical protein